ncbi:MAG TPA: MaoC family dehydratase [Kofleriaceae bacterium]|nr:MaoC family dehydratase [Kofleriaceae bacterium]
MPGRFFEEFRPGQLLRHPTPRTVHGGDLSLYIALTGDARPLASSTDFAQSLGFEREVAHDLLVFHLVFGKSVTDVSANAVANLGYADVRFLAPVYPGDTLRAESEVIGVREVSSGKAGVVWVRTRGIDGRGNEVLRFIRWVMVEKRDPAAPAPEPVVPEVPAEVPASELRAPSALNLDRFADIRWATGGEALWEDYQVGQRIAHPGGMTLDESDHTLATRLYQNNARVHFDARKMAGTRFGRRLVYGGHVMSVAHALAHRGLENVLTMAAWNGGTHANPTVAGDTLYAWSEVLGRAEVPGAPGLGALRLRLVAVKNVDPMDEEVSLKSGNSYDPRVVLDLDWWGLVPRREAAAGRA